MNRTTIALLVIAALSVVLTGCGDSGTDPSTANAQTSKSGAVATGAKTENGAAVVNSPTADVPPGGIVLRPANPNDPKFQADPKLKGGGGG